MQEKELTGYPSIDKPWLKYYSEEAINAPLPECTIYEYLWENNKEHLDDIALIYFGRKITYRELFEEIDKTARAFASLGLKAGDVCTVVSVSCVNSVVVFYALNKIGAVSNYINVIASEEEFQKYIHEADSKCVVTMDLFAEKVIRAVESLNTEKVIVFSVADYMPTIKKTLYNIKTKKQIQLEYSGKVIKWRDFIKQSEKVAQVDISHNCNETKIWAHTVGTTGFPKTVLLTDKAYNAVAMQYMKSMSYERGQVFFNIIVPFVVYGMLTCMHMPLCLGLTVVIIPKFEAIEWKKYLNKYHPNHILGIPSYFSPMLQDGNLDKMNLSYILTFGSGGDGMNAQLEEDINEFLKKHGSKAILMKGYGMTEVCASAVTALDYRRSKIGSVGIPLFKNNIRIYNFEKKCECIYGEVGEVLISSPSLMIGYMNNKEETNTILITDEQGTRWVRSGDLGYIDEEGFLFLLGRTKRIMFVGPEGLAYKVFPKQIEDVIITCPAVSEVCVVSTYTGEGFAPKAYVVLKNGVTATQAITEKLKNLCMELPDYLRPFNYEYLEELPKTPVGKVDYRALERMAERDAEK